MYKKLVFAIIFQSLVCFVINAQTYRQLFDQLDAQHYSGNLNSTFNSNFDETIYYADTYLQRSYLTMFKATNDKRYLDKYIIVVKRIQDRRDDRIQNVNSAYLDMPVAFAPDGYTNIIPPYCTRNGTWEIDPTHKAWAHFEHGTNNCFNKRMFLFTGIIIYPMAEFVYLMQTDQSFIDLANMDLPSEVKGFTSEYSMQAVNSYGEFSQWLKANIYTTLDYQINKDWSTADDIFKQDMTGTNGGVNQQAAICKAILMAWKITDLDGSPNLVYLDKCRNIGNRIWEEMHNCVDNLGYSPSGQQYFRWYHKLGLCGEKYEDIGHAFFEIEFMELMYQFGIQTYNGHYFTEGDMKRFATNFESVVYDHPMKIFMNVFGNNDNCNQLCADPVEPDPVDKYYISSNYTFLSKYNSAIYQVISDFFAPDGNPNTYAINKPVETLLAYAFLVQYQQLFNPVAVKRGTHTPYVDPYFTGATDGKIFAGLPDESRLMIIMQNYNYSPTTSGYYPAKLLLNSLNSNKSIEQEIVPLPVNGVWRGLAAGNFDSGTPEEEFVTMDASDNTLHLFKYGSVSGQVTNISSINLSVAQVAFGDKLFSIEYSSAYAGKEILYLGKNGSIYLFGYDGLNLVALPFLIDRIFNLGYADVISSCIGNFDGTDDQELAVLLSNQPQLFIYKILPNGSLLTLYSTSFPNTFNYWLDMTSGDFDGDGHDELCLYNNSYDRDADAYVICKVKNGAILQVNQQLTPPSSGLMCSTSLGNSHIAKKSLVVCRNFDRQVSIFNFDGLCPGLVLAGQTIDASTSINHPDQPDDNYPIDYHVNNTLLAGNNFIIDAPSVVEMSAGNEIIFKNGFSINSGAEVHAYLDQALACNSTALRQASVTPKSPSKYKPAYLPGTKVYDQPPVAAVKPRLSIKPNPTHGTFNIEYSEKEIAGFEIFDLYGKRILDYNYSVINNQSPFYSGTINLNNVSEGIYILKIKSVKGEITVGKVIIN